MFLCAFITVYCMLCSMLFSSVCAYINSGDATYWDISRLLIGYQLHHGGCASCTDSDIILYSQQVPIFS